MAPPKRTRLLRSSKASSAQAVRAPSFTTRSQTSSASSSSNQRASTSASSNQNGQQVLGVIPTVFDAGDCNILPTQPTIAEYDLIQQTKEVIVILDASGASTRSSSARIPIRQVIEAKIPRGCLVANRGQAFGGWTRDATAEYPGIPTKYFTSGDVDNYGGDLCTVQCVFEVPQFPKLLIAKYLGWDASAAYEENKDAVFKKFPYVKKWITMKTHFLDAIKTLEPNNLVGVKRERYLDDGLLTEKENIFWIYQEMSYLHSFINRCNGLPFVWYMNVKNTAAPPKFCYSVVNVIEKKLLDEYQKQEAGLKKVKKIKQPTGERTACEKPETCVCDSIFEYYDRKNRDEEELPDADDTEATTRKNMQPDSSGRLDFSRFDTDDQRMVVECSDACGCSMNCPRRQLQRGQKVGVVVYYEDECRQFGLRALEPIKQGQFIIEYTGQILEVEPEGSGVIEDRDVSYDAVFAIMDRRKVVNAINIGNAARFMSHACDPSAVFIETHSRQLVSDPLIPRIAVYALKDINVGEEITIKYFCQDLMSAKDEGIKCRCRPDCPNWLPIYPFESDDDDE
ncbi:unnamed protein product [Caenorhabditis nigoni]